MSRAMHSLRLAASMGMGLALACGGSDPAEPIGWTSAAASVDSEPSTQAPAPVVSAEKPASEAAPITAADEVAEVEVVPERQEFFGFDTGIHFPDSCNDITGTDPILAALAVSTATELRRWQPKADFRVMLGKLALTATGRAQCADAQCPNTQALLDLQNDEASQAVIRPGVRVSPVVLRRALSLAHFRQATCFSNLGVPFVGCSVPDHVFTLAHTEPGECDTNYWFTTTTRAGEPLTPALMQQLEKSLIWVNAETNDYIQFQTDGNLVGIDPTYGLNEAGSTESGSCAAACTRISSRDLLGSCCSCDGIREYARAPWNANTYICQ